MGLHGLLWVTGVPICKDTSVWCVWSEHSRPQTLTRCESALHKFNVAAAEHIVLLTLDRTRDKLGHRPWWKYLTTRILSLDTEMLECRNSAYIYKQYCRVWSLSIIKGCHEIWLLSFNLQNKPKKKGKLNSFPMWAWDTWNRMLATISVIPTFCHSVYGYPHPHKFSKRIPPEKVEV